MFPPLSLVEPPDCPSLRASDEHRFIVRVLRARMMVWRLPRSPLFDSLRPVWYSPRRLTTLITTRTLSP